MLESGLYEQVLNRRIRQDLETVADRYKWIEAIDEAEAPRVLSQYLAETVERSLNILAERGETVTEQIALVNRLLGLIAYRSEAVAPEEAAGLAVDREGKQLLAYLSEKDPRSLSLKKAKDLDRPETSLAVSSLFTGAKREPPLYTELQKEIRSADRIDILVSFIRFSGLRLILDELKQHVNSGRKLRILTTTYMGATQPEAIRELNKLPNTQIKISYDTLGTRLHAKSYIFHRKTGFTTAYVGSSNLSYAALTEGLEWNIKATTKDLPDTIAKIVATFESYWLNETFEPYDDRSEERLYRSLRHEKGEQPSGETRFLLDVRPYNFQKEILDRLTAERAVRGRYKNLIVAATGTGKTMISAFDYRNYVRHHPQRSNRLLFVAHREEILIQSREAFRQVLRDVNFGDLFVGNYRPDHPDHLFISIQTLNAQRFCEYLPADYYDYIVVDEFHHAAAPTYQALLNHFRPGVLLGLTATPERMDGRSILDYFDQRIAAEIRLPEAIERGLLSPFQYFGVSDDVDLSTLTWTRGGYDRNELSKVYTLDQVEALRRVDTILSALKRYIGTLNEVKGLGFCVSVEHAHFMAQRFNEAGLSSLALSAASPDEERKTAKKRLAGGELRFIFVVDLYNEGVDIPQVNTVLFLRPTESLTVFLQQLGRGLRLSEGKECLTVLDFVGQANRRYNFEEKFAALLSNSRHSVQYELEHGFVSMPRGCYIHLEKQASKIILENLRESFRTRSGLVNRIRNFTEDTGLPLSLEAFLSHHRIDIKTLYSRGCFSELKVAAEVVPPFDEPLKKIMPNALKRLAPIDSRRWINFLLEVLPRIGALDPETLSPEEARLLRMFHITVWQKGTPDLASAEVRTNFRELAASPVFVAELTELLTYNLDHIDFVDEPVDVGFACPLDLHCTYTRDQLFAALDVPRPQHIREGVKWLSENKLDVFLITLNKSDKDYSPSTMYEDYSINDRLFHWQSQSTTSETSVTGRRYINHEKEGVRILLFVREYKKDELGAQPYTFLGTARYVSHEGSRPMSIIWELDRPVPAKYLKKTGKLVVA